MTTLDVEPKVKSRDNSKQSLILLVEDNPDDEMLARRAMKKSELNLKIVTAHDGVEALDILLGRGSYSAQGAIKPDLVLLDLNLPRMGGLDVLRELNDQGVTRRFPIVVLTTSCEDKDLVDSYDLGINSYIQKPVNFHEFIDSVKQLGIYWLMLNRVPRNSG